LAQQPEDRQRYASLAERLKIPIVDTPTESAAMLENIHGVWQIRLKTAQGWMRYRPDFSIAPTKQHQSRANHPLLRAVQAPKQAPPIQVLDATAGWGRDACLMAQHQCQVLMVEQNPVVHFLLQQALNTVSTECPLQPQNLILGNALETINAQQRLFDVIYLDPMFGWENKSARPAKDMQVLHRITHNTSMQSLAQAALGVCRRLVVKRDAKAQALLEGAHHNITEGVVRYDVYLGRG